MKTKREITFVILLIPFTVGILLAGRFPSRLLESYCAYFSGALLFGLVALNIGYAKYRIYNFQVTINALLYLLIFLLGSWAALRNSDSIQEHYFAEAKTDYLTVNVDEEPLVKASSIRFKGKVIAGYFDNQPLICSGSMMITIRRIANSKLNLKYGDQILIPSHYTEIPPVKNDGEFDYSAWLATKNIFMQAYVKEEMIRIINEHQGSFIRALAITIRQEQVNVLRKLISQAEALSVASTLILGFRTELDETTLSAYSKTGTIHVLSVSGMHVGIIYIVLNTLLAFLEGGKIRRLFKAILIIILIWSYATLTGLSPSVLRSAVMLTCFVVAKLSRRRSNNFNILCFSAFILLIENPLLIYDAGFQLSYIAVWGLLFVQPIIYKKWEIHNRNIDKIWQYISFSLAAQIATFPLSIYYFHQFPVYFLISNLLILIPAAVMMYLGFAILLLHLYFLAPVLEYLITVTNQMLKWIADQPYATINGIWLNKTESILLCLVVFFTVKCVQELSKARVFITMLTMITLQMMISVKSFRHFNQRKTVAFNLRKHYAKAHLHGHYAIIFTNLSPDSKTYEYSIKPYLEKNGITSTEIKYSP